MKSFHLTSSLMLLALLLNSAEAQESTERNNPERRQDRVEQARGERGGETREGERRDAQERRSQEPEAETRRTNRGADFEPQNDRERALLEMIKQLRNEVSMLRRQLEQTRMPREGQRDLPREASDARRPAEGTRDQAATRNPAMQKAQNPAMQKAQRIFIAYDKNQDGMVSFEEWLAMREGEMTSERRAREQQHFSEPAGDDQKISPEEFFRWMDRRSRGATREGALRGATREGETRDAYRGR